MQLGQGLFFKLHKEKADQVKAEQRALRRRREAQRTECQPYKHDSDSDSFSDDDVIEEDDVDLNEYINLFNYYLKHSRRI